MASEATQLKVVKKALGVSGTEVQAGIYTEEYLSQLQTEKAAQIYEQMRRGDSQVKKILNAVINPIKSAKWEIDPVSDDPMDLKVAALMKQIIFKDIRWSKFLHECLTFIPHGYSVFEPVHENKASKEFGEYTGLKKLGFRRQTSITRWTHNKETGILESVRQEANTGDIVKDVTIPADQLLFFYNEQEGDNNGFPLLRSLYGPWKRKLLALELMYIGIERFAIPTPVLKVPGKIKPEHQEYKDAEDSLRKYTQAEDAFMMVPEGWEIDFNTNNTYDPDKIKKVIKFENEEMAGAILASFLELGTGGNSGAFALASDLSDFFLSVIESFPAQITDTINLCLIPHLVRLNFGDQVDLMPELKFSGISDKAGKELMEVITGYTKAGVVTVDDILEDHVRKVNNLPKKAEGTATDNQEVDVPPEDPNADPDPKVNPEPDPLDDDLDPPKKQQTQTLKLADKKPKDAKQLIERDSEKVNEVIKRNLEVVAEKFIADGMRNYKKLSENGKLRAFDKVKPGGMAQLKKELKAQFTNSANEALTMVRSEVPSKKNIELKDLPEFEGKKKVVVDGTIYKLNDFSRLPKHVQLLLARQADTLSSKLVMDVTNRVKFQFQSSESTTKDPDILTQDMKEAANEVIASGTVQRGATNSTAFVVNDARNTFLFDEQVSEDIQSFTFVNFDPKTEICKRLAGAKGTPAMTFAPGDAEARRFQPPLHHNCKSYIRANLKINQDAPEITGVPTVTSSEREAITLKEGDK